ncbi:hypothetical protein C4J81_07460 [Deltaproteobacteria bacterium Smac51]|nr:hypothetical protein C4J81_07460 [Deltaproteobacteria bacterium Smac51]
MTPAANFLKSKIFLLPTKIPNPTPRILIKMNTIPITDETRQPEAEKNADLIFFDPLAQKAQTLFGVAFTPSARLRLLKAMKARQTKLNIDSFSEYAALLRRDNEEWNRLWPVALAYEGSFFRPAAQFEVARELLAEWSIMAPERTLRVLSLGCGAGFETCSLAMMLEETGLRAKNWQVEIYGLDLNEEAVGQAGLAVFTEADLEWLTEAQRKKWFNPRGGGWCFKSALAPPVKLAAGNIYEPETWPWAELSGAFDLIFCRGVSWEAPPRAPRQLARILRQSLAPSGFIFTAPGEFLPDNSSDLHLEERSGVTYYRQGVNRIKVNRHHVSKKQKSGRGAAAGTRQDNMEGLPPLDLRERTLMEEAGRKLAAGQPEKARALLIEVMTTQMDNGRSQPEAWEMIVKIEEALGRPDIVKATAEVAGQ